MKRFDETPYVKCESCQHYCDSTCDGTEVGEIRNCTAYKVTRTGEWIHDMEELRDAIAEIAFLKAMCFVACVMALIGLFT